MDQCKNDLEIAEALVWCILQANDMCAVETSVIELVKSLVRTAARNETLKVWEKRDNLLQSLDKMLDE